jgi:monooxygenase
MSAEHVDVLIVGAGLSGIGAAYYIQTRCPHKSYAVLEGRDSIGGTWDLFRYPGVRSDSDMFTLGFSFRPWNDPKSIADGPSILKYIRDTAKQFGIDQKIRFGHRVHRAEWSSEEMHWTVEAECGSSGVVRFTCSFLYLCTGYYDYERGYMPEWPGLEQFTGKIVHPQQWPEDLDYMGKQVVVIGSGATAITLVPAMAKQAAHVTMLQRSPTYITSLPAEDSGANWLRSHLPDRLSYGLVRWRNVLIMNFYYSLMRRKPAQMKQELIKLVREQLGPDYDVDTHFTPRYNPWDQRLCFVPDGDLFEAIKAGTASVVTDQIKNFTSNGICLQSGNELHADIIVTATGLVMKLMCGLQLCVDGRSVEPSQTMSYKGMMFSNVPNLAGAIGYTNASWTLKCELISQYVCRLLHFMDRHGYGQCTPRRTDPTITEEPIVDFTSGYIQRALPSLPSQGSKRPWKVYQNYLLDTFAFRLSKLNDGVIVFERKKQPIPN